MSSFSFLFAVFLAFACVQAWSQQKVNDFTRKFRSMDGKLSDLSGKRLSSGRMNSAFSKRIKISEWPAAYSSFGSRRSSLQGESSLGSQRVEANRVEINTPLNRVRSSVNTQRVSESDLGDSTAAVASIEYRDAVYAELDKRVDAWMEKVNNMSLRDVNRYQFRKGRPSEPGFPVQKAGSEPLPAPSGDAGLGSPSLRGVTPSGTPSQPLQSYWLDPKKIRTTGRLSGTSPRAVPAPAPSPSRKNFKSYPKPLFGPKKVRVQVK